MPTSIDKEPKLLAKLTPTTDAYFSIGYCGAPAYSIAEVEEIFQPLPFTEKRFPSTSYLTPAYKVTLPTTLATINGTTYGVVADAVEFPFNPLPNRLSRSPFGVAIRDNAGKVRPMVWALIMGNDDSKITANTEYSFNYRLYLSKRSLTEAYEDIARRLYGFSDFRHNDLGSLNSAFENMVDFAMSTYGKYNDEMKGYSYETDIPNSVKNTSALPIHSIAFILDDSLIFKDRALPITEFMLSRENYAYAKDYETGAGQTAYNSLGDPSMNLLEMIGYYTLGEKHSAVLPELANLNAINYSNKAFEKEWRENIAIYKSTGETSALLDVIDGANKYISERINEKQTDFNYLNHSKSSFWSSLAPKFWELYETYKITGYQRYLDAARLAARSYAYHLWMSPAIPDENVLCNIGDKAPSYRSGTPISIAEEEAPAWRLSAIGLSCEAGGTASSGHRAVFMGNHAPFFMRIGALTNDRFLMDIAKAAIIGRWRSFPGYHINTDRTTVYEKEDFADRDMADLLTTTSMHYSHVWPMIALTFDYLVSDAFAKSGGEIDFPSVFIENTANLYNNLYFKPGQFYNEKNVTLWMPSGLVNCDNPELNYIVARGNGKLYLAFVNQNNSHESANITLNNEFLKEIGASAQVWTDNSETGMTSVSTGEFSISVSANGITAIAIEGVKVNSDFQDKMFFQSEKNDWLDAYEEIPAVDSRAMVLGFSNDYTRVYAYSDAEKGTNSNVRFQTFYDNVEQDDILDEAYPFEYGQWIPRKVNTVKLIITPDGGVSEEVIFTRQPYELSASVSGWTSVLKGESVPINFKTNGKPPWQLTYTDGETEFEQEIYTSVFTEMVSLQNTTTYKIISAIDAYGETATVEEKTAKVSIIDEYLLDYRLNASQDAHVYLLGSGNNYGSETSMSVKGKESSRKELYLEFDLSKANKNGEIYLLGLWLTSKIDSTSVIEVSGGSPNWTETTITWSTKPESEQFDLIDTIGISKLSPEGSFHYFNVTEYINNSSSDKLTFKVKFLKGDENLTLNFASKEANNEATAPCLISDVALNGTTGINDEQQFQAVKLIIQDEYLIVNSQKQVNDIKVYNMSGVFVGKYETGNIYNLAGAKSGIYTAIIKVENKLVVKKFFWKGMN